MMLNCVQGFIIEDGMVIGLLLSLLLFHGNN